MNYSHEFRVLRLRDGVGIADCNIGEDGEIASSGEASHDLSDQIILAAQGYAYSLPKGDCLTLLSSKEKAGEWFDRLEDPFSLSRVKIGEAEQSYHESVLSSAACRILFLGMFRIFAESKYSEG